MEKSEIEKVCNLYCSADVEIVQS